MGWRQSEEHSPARLASHLDLEGLTHEIDYITLFACSAGASRPEAGINESYATLFKAALQERGFDTTAVFAYTGDLAAKYLHRRRVDQDGKYQEYEVDPDLTATRHKGVWDPELEEYIPASVRKIRVKW